MSQDKISDLLLFFSQFSSFRYKKGDTILFANEEPTGVYFIVKGYVRTYGIAKNGRQLVNSFHRPTDVFPLLWALFDIIPTHTFEALTEVEVYKAPKKDYVDLLHNDQSLYAFTAQRLVTRVSTIKSRFEIALIGTARERVISVLLFLAENLGILIGETTSIEAPITHQEIADMIGLTRETVTLEIDKLLKEGLLSSEGRKLLISKKLKQDFTDFFE